MFLLNTVAPVNVAPINVDPARLTAFVNLYHTAHMANEHMQAANRETDPTRKGTLETMGNQFGSMMRGFNNQVQFLMSADNAYHTRVSRAIQYMFGERS